MVIDTIDILAPGDTGRPGYLAVVSSSTSHKVALPPGTLFSVLFMFNRVHILPTSLDMASAMSSTAALPARLSDSALPYMGMLTEP